MDLFLFLSIPTWYPVNSRFEASELGIELQTLLLFKLLLYEDGSLNVSTASLTLIFNGAKPSFPLS